MTLNRNCTRNFSSVSITLDETSDVQDKPQLSLFVHTAFDDCVVGEELLDIVSLKDRTHGRDLKKALMLVATKNNLPLQKLTAIAQLFPARREGKVISCFVELLEPVKLFMKEKHRIHFKLTDPVVGSRFGISCRHGCCIWINVDLQQKLRLLSNLVQSVFAFINKLQLFHRQMLE